MSIRFCCLAFLIVVLHGAAAAAEDPGRFGVTMGYPASVGLLVRAGHVIAVRPYVTFTSSSSSVTVSETTGIAVTETAETKTTSTGAGLSALIYIKAHDNLRMYASPDVAFQHAGVTGGSTNVPAKTNAYSVGGFFGAEYTLSRRFGLFAEAGLKYTHSTMKQQGLAAPILPSGVIGASPLEVQINNHSTTHAVQTATGIGAILYF